MAGEPENLVLELLRSIRSDMTDVKATLAEHTKSFVKLEHRLDEVHEGMITGLGLAANANVRHNSVQDQLDELKDRLTQLEDLKARVTRLEEKV
jgi:hypothetical protein